MSGRGRQQRVPHAARPGVRHASRIIVFLGFLVAAWIAGAAVASAASASTAAASTTPAGTASTSTGPASTAPASVTDGLVEDVTDTAARASGAEPAATDATAPTEPAARDTPATESAEAAPESGGVSSVARAVTETGAEQLEPVTAVVHKAQSVGSASPTTAVGGESVRSTVDAATNPGRPLESVTDAVAPSADIAPVGLDATHWDPEDRLPVPFADAEGSEGPESSEGSERSADGADEDADAPDEESGAAADSAETAPSLFTHAAGNLADYGGVTPEVAGHDSPAEDSPAGASDRASAAVTSGSTGQGPAFADLAYLPTAPTDTRSVLFHPALTTPPTLRAADEPSFSPD